MVQSLEEILNVLVRDALLLSDSLLSWRSSQNPSIARTPRWIHCWYESCSLFFPPKEMTSSFKPQPEPDRIKNVAKLSQPISGSGRQSADGDGSSIGRSVSTGSSYEPSTQLFDGAFCVEQIYVSGFCISLTAWFASMLSRVGALAHTKFNPSCIASLLFVFLQGYSLSSLMCRPIATPRTDRRARVRRKWLK